MEGVLGVLGDPIPFGDVHGVSVMLPKWKDTVGWSSRDPRVLDCMKTGYPRFFIHRMIVDLAARLVEYQDDVRLGRDAATIDDTALALSTQNAHLAVLFPCYQSANLCKAFLQRSVPLKQRNEIQISSFDATGLRETAGPARREVDWQGLELHSVTYPADLFPLAKSFWQHTGFGISSRYCAMWIGNERIFLPGRTDPKRVKELLPLEDAINCKQILQQRIASLSSTSSLNVCAKDVFLYQSGMAGIGNIAAALQASWSSRAHPCTVAVFGFLYVDTFKILTKVYGFEAMLYGQASKSEIDDLETQLASGRIVDALFTEFPGNPLLKSPDLKRLHQLSQKYGFVLVIDDTIGTFVNLTLLHSCDIICTSLTKMFSGGCNVMGGSVVLNPSSTHFTTMRSLLSSQFVDCYFPSDVILMESNSRDFKKRVLAAGENAEVVWEILRKHPTVTQVYYPKGSDSQDLYDAFRTEEGNYGFLLSATFVSPACAIAFHDALNVAKGPSLGTNFTLACAYTLLAHYNELEWAAEFGVVEYLFRISVGLESREILIAKVKTALMAAESQAGHQTTNG